MVGREHRAAIAAAALVRRLQGNAWLRRTVWTYFTDDKAATSTLFPVSRGPCLCSCGRDGRPGSHLAASNMTSRWLPDLIIKAGSVGGEPAAVLDIGKRR